MTSFAPLVLADPSGDALPAVRPSPRRPKAAWDHFEETGDDACRPAPSLPDARVRCFEHDACQGECCYHVGAALSHLAVWRAVVAADAAACLETLVLELATLGRDEGWRVVASVRADAFGALPLSPQGRRRAGLVQVEVPGPETLRAILRRSVASWGYEVDDAEALDDAEEKPEAALEKIRARKAAMGDAIMEELD